MLNYKIELSPRGNKGKPTMWEGSAVNVIDAIQLAKESVFPNLHTARVIKIGDKEHGEPEGN